MDVVAGEEPIAGLTASSSSPTMQGYTTLLSAQVVSGTNVSYTWGLGDGNTAGGAQVAYVYPGPGVYEAVVTASNPLHQVTATTVVSVATAIPLDPRWGGLLFFSDTQGLTTTVQAPPGAVTQTTLLGYFPLLTPTQPLTPGLSFCRHAFHLEVSPRFYIYLPIAWGPPAGPPAAIGWVRTSALLPPRSPAPEAITFLKPVTITIYYSDDDVAGLDENTLGLVYWTGAAWAEAADTCVPASPYFRDLEENILAVAVCHLTEFAMVGQ